MIAIATLSIASWHVVLLAILLAACSFALQGRQGINLSDEGFLWYGTQRTFVGEVPLRDFQSYDPGRYYWGAAGMFLFGNGLVGLRLSETIFQAIGLCAGLLAATRITSNWALLAGIGVMLTLWMFPTHKLFDHTILLCGIWVAIRLIEEPSAVRIFSAGLFLGLCVFFGKNHALYNFLAQFLLLLLLHLKAEAPSLALQFATWLGGAVIGFLPMIGLLMFAPRFPRSYVESIRSIFRHGTNLSLPIPWPGKVWPDSVAGAARFVLGIFLVVLPLGYIAAIGWSLSMPLEVIRNHPLFVGCAFVGAPYLHHGYARADASHLAQIIHPFALAALDLPALLGAHESWRWIIVAAFIATALFIVGRQTPFYQRLTSAAPWMSFDAGGKIFVPPNINSLFTRLRAFAAENIAARDGVLIAPLASTLYPILQIQSPLWNLAYYFPATPDRQEEMIQELAAKNVNWAIISDTPPDKREDLRFSITHNLVWQYLANAFEPAQCDALPKSMTIFRRKQRGD